MTRSVNAVLFDRDRVLVIQRSHFDTYRPGTWALPGGKVESLEPEFETACREVWEETNIVVRSVRRIGPVITEPPPGDERRDGYHMSLILVEPIGGPQPNPPRPDMNEATGVAMFSRQDAEKHWTARFVERVWSVDEEIRTRRAFR